MASSAAKAIRNGSNLPAGTAVAFNGIGLNIDHTAYMAQHDVVYRTPPLEGAQAMPIGDGDVGAMVWCPNYLRLQVQKNDLWADPNVASEDVRTPASAWRQCAAGAVSIVTGPGLLAPPFQFEQRLCLHSGLVTINADTAHGPFQATMFAAATAGVLVVRYEDRTRRSSQRWVDVSLWRDAHTFALNNTVGVLQAFPDRRYTMLARIGDRNVHSRMVNKNTARLDIEPYGSGGFTLYIAVATSPRSSDPINVAKARIEAAMSQGYDALLAEHKQHWAQFWQKSFISLRPDDPEDTLPNYLENLWFLHMYYLAACSRAHDLPLSNGALWMHNQDARSGPALYEGAALRRMNAPLAAANHLELTVPYTETYVRMLPTFIGRTQAIYKVSGARFPERFNHLGQAFEAEAPGGSEGGTRIVSGEGDGIGDGLGVAVFLWNIWRHGPDYFHLRERVYPMLRVAVSFALDYLSLNPIEPAEATKALLAEALRALLWCGAELERDEEYRSFWQQELDLLNIQSLPELPDCSSFAALSPEESVAAMQDLLSRTPQLASGLFGDEARGADLQSMGRFMSGLMTMLLREEPKADELPRLQAPEPDSDIPMGALRVFQALPASWHGAFMLAAPGGFRVCGEAFYGKTRYVAVQSLNGGTCRIVNPWGEGHLVRVREGRAILAEKKGAVLTFATEKDKVYLLEPGELPLIRAVRIRLSAERNATAKVCAYHTLGIY